MAYLHTALDHVTISQLDQGIVAFGSHRLCAGCEEQITDKHMLEVMGKHWHIKCLRCADCTQLLKVNCFFRDGDILCDHDFFRRYGKKCSICSEGISPRQQVRKVQHRVYHISCFSCAACHRQLGTGDLFYLGEDGRVMCKSDFEEGQDKDGYFNVSSMDMMKEKRKRTFINMSQLSTLKTVYKTSPKPTIQERERISNETGLDMRVVQVWFQNRRAKDKRISNRGKLQWLHQSSRRNMAQHTRSLSWSAGCLPEVPAVGNVIEQEDSLEEEIARQVCNLYVSHFTPEPTPPASGRRLLPPKLRLGMHASNCSSAPTSPFLQEASDKGAPVFTFPTIPQESPIAPPLDIESYFPESPCSTIESLPNSSSEASGFSAPNTPAAQVNFLFDPEAIMACSFSPEEVVAACSSPGYGCLPK